MEEQSLSNRGGHNKEHILMTVINTFKKLCMKACTQRADEVCDYYIKMEQIMQRYVHQRLQIQSKRPPLTQRLSWDTTGNLHINLQHPNHQLR